jgi:hypothetical protein
MLEMNVLNKKIVETKVSTFTIYKSYKQPVMMSRKKINKKD